MVITSDHRRSTITIRASDDKVVEESKKDPKSLTVTTTDKDGKKTITYVQKSTEKTELPKDVLYVIDGKEMESGSMKDIDPNMIKSINVLFPEPLAPTKPTASPFWMETQTSVNA